MPTITSPALQLCPRASGIYGAVPLHQIRRPSASDGPGESRRRESQAARVRAPAVSNSSTITPRSLQQHNPEVRRLRRSWSTAGQIVTIAWVGLLPGKSRMWSPGWRKAGRRFPPQITNPFNSLFGEILDWMLAPLLFLGRSPSSSPNVANSIANQPCGQALAVNVRPLPGS